VWQRVPLLVAFAEFADLNGARSVADLPGHVDAFVDKRAPDRKARPGQMRAEASVAMGIHTVY